MEKVKIKSVVNSGREWEGKKIFTVELEDGRKGDTFAQDALNWVGEMELEIKESEYNKQKQYKFALPKQANIKGGFPTKDYTFEKRKTSLECAINSIKLTDKQVTSTNIIALANEYFNYLTQK